MNEVPITSQEKKEECSSCCKTRNKMLPSSTCSSQGTSFTSDQVREPLGISYSMPTLHKKSWMKLQQESWKFSVHRDRQFREGVGTFTMNLAFQKMMMDLIGAANYMCTLYRICVHFGAHQEDLESRASIILTPPVSEPASSS